MIAAQIKESKRRDRFERRNVEMWRGLGPEIGAASLGIKARMNSFSSVSYSVNYYYYYIIILPCATLQENLLGLRTSK